MNKPSVGQAAPDFTVPVVGADYPAGSTISLRELRDKPVVLYFYPKDDTPGCTVQACSIRDSWAELKPLAHVFGVSIDGVKSHEKFIRKHGLPFPILSDESRSLVGAYGVWVEKSMYGKTYMGTERSTFVIGTDGKIRALLEKVKPAEHVELVKEALRGEV